MVWDSTFFLNAILLGLGLAMDAFSVSLANGLSNPDIKFGRNAYCSSIFGMAQSIMPMVGWICVHTLLSYFAIFEHFIPWIALILLTYIGGKMIYEGFCKKEECTHKKITVKLLILQAIATSIDALSVGFTIAEQDFYHAFVTITFIGVITFGLCLAGVFIGKKFGTKLSNKATIFGGIILVIIGLEIFIKGMISLYA